MHFKLFSFILLSTAIIAAPPPNVLEAAEEVVATVAENLRPAIRMEMGSNVAHTAATDLAPAHEEEDAFVKLQKALKSVNVEVPEQDFEEGFDDKVLLEIFESANAHIEVKEALKDAVLARLTIMLKRTPTPAEEQSETAELELGLALAKAKLQQDETQLTAQILEQHPEVAQALQKVETAMAQLEADQAENEKAAVRSALMQKGIPIFKIATPSDIQAAEGNKIALPAVESDHHEIEAADARCAICLGKYKDGAEIAWLKCNHHGDVGCLASWLQKSHTCHMCRQTV